MWLMKWIRFCFSSSVGAGVSFGAHFYLVGLVFSGFYLVGVQKVLMSVKNEAFLGTIDRDHTKRYVAVAGAMRP